MRGARALGAVALALALGGCRQVLGLDERAVGPAELTPENVVPAVARAYCESLAPCCREGGFDFAPPVCEASVAASYQEFVGGALRARLVFSPEAAATCVRTIVALADTCSLTDEQEASLEVCEGTFTGVKAPGELCSVDAECAEAPGESASCDDEPQQPEAPRRCRTSRRGAEGEACGELDAYHGVGCDYEAGLICDRVTRTCAQLAGPGAPCFDRYDCRAGLACRSGRCEPATGVGGACAPDSMGCADVTCQGLRDVCAFELRCDEASGTCVERLPLGAPCGVDDQCTSHRCSAGACAPANNRANADLCGAPTIPGAPDPESVRRAAAAARERRAQGARAFPGGRPP